MSEDKLKEDDELDELEGDMWGATDDEHRNSESNDFLAREIEFG